MNIYETHVMKDPQLPFIFRTNRLNLAKKRRDVPNWHENIEILLITEGRGSVLYDTQQLSVEEGDIVVVNSNSVHCLYTEESVLSYHYLIVDRSFCVANHFDPGSIRFDMHFRDEEIERLMRGLEKEYASQSNSPFHVQMIRALVLQIMATVCRNHGVIEESSHLDSHLLTCIKQSIGYIHSQIERDISLDEVAEFVGLSKFYFAREFRRITGNTFVSYINLVRCERAKKMLAENRMHVGEIARACGFENQSYFTRRFRSYTGMLPSDYRKRQLQKKSFDLKNPK